MARLLREFFFLNLNIFRLVSGWCKKNFCSQWFLAFWKLYRKQKVIQVKKIEIEKLIENFTERIIPPCAFFITNKLIKIDINGSVFIEILFSSS